MDRPSRKSPRLQGFDYRSNESYFVTVCLKERSPLFGKITDDARLVQSDIGNMIAITWIGITDQFQTAVLHDFVVMPDHIHGSLTLDRSDLDDDNDGATLGDVIGWFKGKSTFLYGQGVKDRGWPRYSGKFWQPRFHDHIIRDDRDFNARVLYIERNPWRWVENRT